MTDFLSSLGYLALGTRFRRISDQLVGAVGQAYAAAGVAFEPRCFPLLQYIHRCGPTSVGHAARALGLSHVAVSQLSQKLAKQNIVTRKTDPKDERRKVLALTGEGEAILVQLKPIWGDIRECCKEVSGELGVDILNVLDTMEYALADRPLAERMATCRKKRMHDGLKLVDYCHAHRGDFEQLNREWLEPIFGVEKIDEQIFADPKSAILDPGGAILFAQSGDERVGTVSLIKRDENTLELAKMGVRADQRGRSVGRFLCQEALARAQKMGAKKVMIETARVLTHAVTLYRKMGFKVLPNPPADSHYQRTDMAMELDLATLPQRC